MLTYNNKLKPLTLPEYGRNFQKMLDHCLSIEDKDERTHCARSIIDSMSVIFQPQGDKYLHRLKLWNHLAMMSDFKLDVDLPFVLARPEEFAKTPEPVALGSGHANRKVYGCLLELMIREAAMMEDGDERDELIYLLAAQMKKDLMALNPDGVDDDKVFRDLAEMTSGRVVLTTDKVKLPEYKLPPAQGKKKKKK